MHRLAAACLLLPLGACSPHGGSANADGGIDKDAEVALLPDPDGGATWDDWTAMFVQDYCVECHNPAASCFTANCHPTNGDLPDFRIKSDVVGWAPMIRCGIGGQQDPAWQCPGAIQPYQFPVEQDGNPLPTDDERAIVIAWIDAGCP